MNTLDRGISPHPEYLDRARSIRTAAQDTADYLFHTFFQKDTWDVRQLGAYGIMIPKKSGEGIDLFDPSPAFKRMLSKINTQLGDRFSYFQSGYHFIDNLWGVARGTEILLDDEFQRSSPNIYQDAQRILKREQGFVAKLEPELETFLAGDAKKAFSITLDLKDPKNLQYKIENVVLDPAEIRAKWAKLHAAVFPQK
jgi:hypothetical protein